MRISIKIAICVHALRKRADETASLKGFWSSGCRYDLWKLSRSRHVSKTDEDVYLDNFLF